MPFKKYFSIKYTIFLLMPILLGLVTIMGINTILMHSRQPQVESIPLLSIDKNLVAEHLSGSLKFRTISSIEEPDLNIEEFNNLHMYLKSTYPLLHQVLAREKIGNNSLLYTWEGSDPEAKPIALMAHQDVVPAEMDTENGWLVDPFGGVIENGFVWGRGALDNKGNLIAQMEAVEMLLATGFKPRQTIYLIQGDDEEVGGQRGARSIAALLKSRGVRLEYILDEGLLITEGILPNIQNPVALIGIAEKGYATYSLQMDGLSGHSSMPPKETTIGIMSAALLSLENNPMPASIHGVPTVMFETLAPEMKGFSRVVMSNLWLFGPLLKFKLQQANNTNALLRTTSALTIFTSGNRDNVLPSKADATINFRLVPGDTVVSVGEHIRETIKNDTIKINLSKSSEATPASSVESLAYNNISRTLKEVFPDVVIAPSLMIAATDARHFREVADDIYRFSPIRASSDDLHRFHGENERLSVENLSEAVRFYYQLLSR